MTTKHSPFAYIGACLTFVSCGPTLILLNNRLLHDFKFPFPIALSALGVGFAAIVSHVLLVLGIVKFEKPELVRNLRFYVTNALPNAILAATTLALGNSAYVYLSVAMCQMLKALTPAITLALLMMLRVESPTAKEICCVALITVGTLIATRGEVSLSAIGLALQLGANFAEAMRVVLAQRLLANMRLPLLEMQYHVAPTQLLCLLTASAFVELRDPADRATAVAALSTHPIPFAVAGMLGLLVQLAGLLTVKIAGSVAVKLLGIARGAALVLFEAAFASASSSPAGTQLMGYGASVVGFFLYTWSRLSREGQAQVATSQQNAKKKD